ncbi:MAG: SIMPL domain-containing protein [Candidatus Pacearchaeota archaeon]
MKTQNAIITGMVIVAVVILVLGVQLIDINKETGMLNAEGKSELTFAPDNAKVFVGVSITKPTAKEAQDEENRVIAAIIKDLKALGISEADIETESINLYEDKVWTEKEMKSNGWKATQILKVKTKDFSKVGKIVDISINNGANEINNIQFYLSQEKENEYKQQAIAQATKSAHDKAKVMADSLGKKLGKVKSVTESNYGYMPYMYDMKNSAGVMATQESASVMPQDVTVTANIVVTYEII